MKKAPLDESVSDFLHLQLSELQEFAEAAETSMVGQAEVKVLKEQMKQYQHEIEQLKNLVKEMKDELACKDRRIEKLDSAKITVELATTFHKIKEERSQFAKEVS